MIRLIAWLPFLIGLVVLNNSPALGQTHQLLGDLDPEFYEAILPFEGVRYTGTLNDEEGTTCHVLIRELIDKNIEENYWHEIVDRPDTVTIQMLMMNTEAPEALLDIETASDFELAYHEWVNGRPTDLDMNRISTSGDNTPFSGRVSRTSRNRYNEVQAYTLGFYQDQATPSLDEAQLVISADSDSNPLKAVKFIEYENWFIPVVENSPVKNKTVCTIDH